MQILIPYGRSWPGVREDALKAFPGAFLTWIALASDRREVPAEDNWLTVGNAGLLDAEYSPRFEAGDILICNGGTTPQAAAIYSLWASAREEVAVSAALQETQRGNVPRLCNLQREGPVWLLE